MFIRRAAGKSGVTVEKSGGPDYPGLKRGLSGVDCPGCPGTPIKWPFDSYLIPLLLVTHDPHMYYIFSLFYHSFALINHVSHIICIALQSSMAYLLIKHHCTRVETETPDQEVGEHESEPVGDDTTFVTQGRHLSISYPIFWINEVYES